ncbi:MAG: hypothetical protein HBSAPP03_13580 [Phycisphaerae bacterium]|nr:MAG: hypothetical protein HBSAPP03_13580 [Phycisphaerae bacterium]
MATPATPARRVPVLAILSLLTWAPVLFALVFIVPAAEHHFRDFGIALPGLTFGLLRFSRWLTAAAPGQFIPSMVFCVAVLAAAITPSWMLWANERTSGPGRALLAIILLLGLLALVAIVVGLGVPYLSTVRALQQGAS